MNSRAVVLSAFAFLSLCLCLGCARDPLRPYPGEPTPPFRPSVDDSPAWSPDGRSIAYHRRFASADGPPGLYIIGAEGGTPHFLALGDFGSPTYLRFSPDSRSLSCVQGIQLLVVDVQTGSSFQPLYTNRGVAQPDWSPGGRSIAYRRLISSGDDPPESLGLHILDLVTGLDRPVLHGGQAIFGSYPVWSHDGQHIAIGEGVSGGPYHISLLSVDGVTLRPLVDAAAGYGLGLLRRYTFRALGVDGLVFGGVTSSGTGPSFMNWDGSGLQQMPPTYHDFDAYSPDGSYAVGPRFSPHDSLEVLFIFKTDDVTGTTYRQLTSYRPPQEAPTAALSPWRSLGFQRSW
ncbi:MAG: hypothetical protein E6K81_14080 [Candidatus Eisenbacteria bacterium]|uniref:Dipeptidylpeptidase IV N-terminal domain-containing protein n=1 Tax=Eiseniibacteriota bacterium TaxID=2212470 RepID=A0A538U1K7_UNCEI|nr:MAG: hypothetical protein E6K81_14080 [Candidatus Eisenbacteria bacterium]